MTSLSDFGRLDEAPPDDRDARLVLADFFQEQGDPRERILRAACAIHREVGGVALPDRFDAFWAASPGWEAAATVLEGLAAAPEDTRAFRKRYGRLLRGDVPLDPEQLEATLRFQYAKQVELLTSMDLLDNDGGRYSITAVDGNRYPLPSFEDLLAGMQAPHLRTKLSQGFDTLLLVPFGLPLERFTDAWREGLRRNAETLRSVGEFVDDEPLGVEGYEREQLVYHPHFLTRTDHGGRTKRQMLVDDRRGWDALLVEGALQNLPLEGEGRRIGGRLQIECHPDREPSQFLRTLQRRGEIGLTPEAYIVQFLDALERRKQVLDIESFSYLVGAWQPASDFVSGARWVGPLGQAHLDGTSECNQDADSGVRAAVRVL